MSDTTCKQAGAVGGKVTLAKYGKAHFTTIGRAGGTSPKHDPVARRAAAARGGEATKAKLTTDDYARIGRIGGEKLKAARGKDYYRDLGRLVQAKRRAQRELAQTPIDADALGHRRAQQLFPLEPCAVCARTPEQTRIDRHHIDGNPLNNDRGNIAFLCASHHRIEHLRRRHDAAQAKNEQAPER